MIELKPITLQALALGVAAIVVSQVALEGDARMAVFGVGTALIGLVLRGPGLLTQSQARREVDRASKAPPPMDDADQPTIPDADSEPKP